jgi:hypothetical protein
MSVSSSPKRLRRWWRWPIGMMLAGLLTIGFVSIVGDFGYTQRVLNGVERRALIHQSTQADKWGLRLLYTTLRLGGNIVHPQAAELLAYYCAGQGDTLHFDARPLFQHPEVQQALRLRKPGITFRHQSVAGPFHVVRHTDWSLYYAFDLLYIRSEPDGIVFYDNYFFQPVSRRSYTRFSFGRLHCKLNDGLIRVAYPQARAFIAYGKVPFHHSIGLTHN